MWGRHDLGWMFRLHHWWHVRLGLGKPAVILRIEGSVNSEIGLIRKEPDNTLVDFAKLFQLLPSFEPDVFHLGVKQVSPSSHKRLEPKVLFDGPGHHPPAD